MPDTQPLMEKIQALPPEQTPEVEDFVALIAARPRATARRASAQNFLRPIGA